MRVSLRGVLIGAVAVCGILVAGGLAMAGPLRQPLPPPFVFVRDPEPTFKPTGGPFIGDAAAVDIALGVAAVSKNPTQAPPHEVRLLPYSAIVQWAGSRTTTIDLNRELYLVVIKSPYVASHGRAGPTTCQSHAVTVDATDGTIRGVSCFLEPWPPRLPAQFGGVVR